MTNNTSIIAKNQNLLSNVYIYSNNYNKTIIICNFYMGRVGFGPTTPATSRRYLNQARPPAPYCLHICSQISLYKICDYLIHLCPRYLIAMDPLAERHQCHF